MTKKQRDEVTKLEWGLLCNAYMYNRVSAQYFLKQSGRFARRLGIQ